jgi:phage terminase large subunit-like protein
VIHASELAGLSKDVQADVLDSLSDAETIALLHDWSFWARPEQLLPEGNWRYWVIKTGRGWGKTRTAAEAVRRWAQDFEFVNIIGATADDARDIMIEGESGILRICPPNERPIYRRHLARLDWPSGCKSLIFTADKPDRLRGKQHEKLWGDEVASWRYLREAWDQAMFGLRLGKSPQVIVSTTPRPLALLRELIEDPRTVLVEGASHENRDNLSDAFFGEIVSKYEGTRLGRQELYGEILEDNPYALWQPGRIEELRVQALPADLDRVVVAVDPSASGNPDSDEAGIVVAGRRGAEAYVLDDLSVRASPHVWASRAVQGYHRWSADRVIGEKNNGGEMVELTLRTVDPKIPYTGVWASRGKRTRAEPVAALYEQGRVHHVGMLAKLEDEMCQWVPGEESPNRMDALVWALTELMITGRKGKLIG